MELLTKLQQTKKQTLVFYDLPDEDLIKTYAEGKWNVRQLLNHLADAETVLYDRIRRVISEPRQVLWGYDQDAWSDKLRYNDFPLAINKNIYSSVRESIIYLSEIFYETEGEKEFVHNSTGVKTLKHLFDKVAGHNEHHLNQVRMALER